MKLYRHQLEIYHPDTKDIRDNRKKIAIAVFSYFDEDNIEYRKKFTGLKNTPELKFWDIAPKIINK